jgi:hypothetical protein
LKATLLCLEVEAKLRDDAAIASGLTAEIAAAPAKTTEAAAG